MNAIVDTRRSLLALLNVVVDDRDVAKRAESFIATYGPLREYRKRADASIKRTTKEVKVGSLGGAFFGPPYAPQDTVVNLAQVFSWAVLLPEESQRNLLNMALSSIFNDTVTIEGTSHGTALDIDIVAGTVEPRPRDLLDAIALELLRSRKVVSRCGICSKFFYKQFSKDKYCSTGCASEARRRGQTEWARKKAAEKEQEQATQNKKARKAH